MGEAGLNRNWVERRTSTYAYNGGYGRRLTLEDFQMDYRKKDVPIQMERVRREKSALMERVKSARQESGTLREYSRRRFQTVVEQETSHILRPPSLRGPPPPRPVTVSGYSHPFSYSAPAAGPPPTPTNGPTKDGSILYNGATVLLQNRPKSEPPSRFDHLRGAYTNYPVIKKTLEQSNCEYRLVATPRHKTRDVGKEAAEDAEKDFVMFVPVYSPDFGSDSLTVDGQFTATPRDVSMEAWTTEPFQLPGSGRPRSPVRPRSPGRPRSPVGDEVREVFAEEEEERLTGRDTARGEKTSPARPPSPRRPPSPQQPALPTSLGLGAVPSQRAAALPVKMPVNVTKPGSRPQSARSSLGSVMSDVSTTPYPHCWVDDVTISSNESVKERKKSVTLEVEKKAGSQLDGPVRGSSPGEKPNADASQEPLKRVASPLQRIREGSGQVISRKGDYLKNRPSFPRSLKHSSAGGGSGSRKGDKPPSVLEVPVVKTEEEDEETVRKSLPRFLCPSSERKSRQVATKEWLAKNSFSAACRTVPIM